MAQQLPEGTATILFTDVVGSTDLATRRGDESARELMRKHEDIVRRHVRDREGLEVKGTGDGFMVAFTSARKAVACAIDIQRDLAASNEARPPEDRLHVRIGLNAGEVIREDADLFGTAVNAASRIASKSEGDQILVSETVRSLIGPSTDFEFLDRGRFRLKGFPDRWRLFEVVWQESAAGAVSTVILAERTPFVGRESERSDLVRVLEQALGGRGALVLLGGEAGVGKSRLADEVAAIGRERGMLALTGHQYEMGGAAPYVAFVEWLEAAARIVPLDAFRSALGESAPEVATLVPELRRTFPDIPQPPELPPEQERRYLFNGVRDFLGRVSSAVPLLLVLDDLHWADEASLLLLIHLAQQLPESRVLIVATYRDTEVIPDSPVARAIEDLTRNRLAQRFTIRRLSETGVSSLLRALSGREPPAKLATVVFSETEGNPFFVEEVVKHLAEEGKLFDETGHWRDDVAVGETEVPESLRMVIERRLGRLDEDVRRALTAAAVVGRNFSFDRLGVVSEMEPDALLDAVDEAERAQLISSAAEGSEVMFAFNHELIRQTLLASVSAARRQRLHLQVAKAMEHAYSLEQREHAPGVAYHLHEAGVAADPAKTAQYLILAGDRALDSAAFEEALRHYQDALTALPADDRRGQADLLHRRAQALRSLARWDEALADWKQALAAYQKLGDAHLVGRISWEVCHQLLWGLRYLEVLEVSQTGLSALGPVNTPERSLLLAAGGLALSLAGFFEPATRMIAEAEAVADTLSDPGVSGEVMFCKGMHQFCHSDFREQEQNASRAVELWRRADNPWELANALWLHQIAILINKGPDEADRMGNEPMSLAERLGHLGALMFAGRVQAYSEIMRTGNIDLFEARSRRDWELCLAAGTPGASLFQSAVAVADFWRGRWDVAAHGCQQAVDIETPGAFAGIDRGLLFLVKAYSADREGALAMLRESCTVSPPEITLRRGVSLAYRMARARKGSGVTLPMLWRMTRERRRLPLTRMLPEAGATATLGEWELLLFVAEGLAILGEREGAAKLYPAVQYWIERSGLIIRFLADRLTHTVAGIAATAGRRYEDAERHYEEALRLAHELPMKVEQPEVRRFYCQMLMERNAAGDRDRARLMLTEAVAMYRKIGMPKHVDLAEALLRDLQPHTPA